MWCVKWRFENGRRMEVKRKHVRAICVQLWSFPARQAAYFRSHNPHTQKPTSFTVSTDLSATKIKTLKLQVKTIAIV